jgi:hypothetical protein
MTERIVQLELGFVPEAAVSGAVLLQSEYSTFLIFNAMTRSEGTELYTDAGLAVCEFTGCTITKFGYPNDEAAAGIPRMKGTLYNVCEVFGSNWAKEITQLNRHSFPQTPDSHQRHFLISFHDSTFECLADDIAAYLSEEPLESTLSKLGRRIAAE